MDVWPYYEFMNFNLKPTVMLASVVNETFVLPPFLSNSQLIFLHCASTKRLDLLTTLVALSAC